jgi:hypothetical protein
MGVGVRVRGCAWVKVGLRFAWVCMGVRGCAWVCLGMRGRWSLTTKKSSKLTEKRGKLVSV